MIKQDTFHIEHAKLWPKLTKIEDPSNTEYWIISQTDTQKQNSEKYSDAWCSNEPGKEKKWSN